MIELEESKAKLEKLQATFSEMHGYLDIENRRVILADLEEQATKPEFWNNQAEAKEIIAKTTAQRAVLRPFDELSKVLDDCAVMVELAESEPEGEARQSALEEAVSAFAKADEVIGRIRLQSLFSGKLDACNAYLTLHSGAGGTEACDWANMLFRMYSMYCEDNQFSLSVLDSQPGDEAGIKSITFRVEGPYAYGMLKGERGVHRLVRISPFDANKRRHTSFASLDVVAELSDDIEVEVKESDLRVDTYRSGGAGGQHINKTDSAVRLTHIPTGIVVACQSERSQHKNRTHAMNVLKAKLYEYYEDKKRKEMERFYGEKGDIAWGNQIRSYVFQPYTMVKDLRTNEETADVQGVMDGHLQKFIEAYLTQLAAKNMAAKPE
ncbi:MAG: peptide chain release factor 2 [Kiritimatiellae bacterium]|nr:peptide chain release factor 2 [Kiritimatiellia bacterium]